jgi:hypothetical protein
MDTADDPRIVCQVAERPRQVEVRKTLRVLVSSAGTRGDVQPVLALALRYASSDMSPPVRACRSS